MKKLSISIFILTSFYSAVGQDTILSAKKEKATDVFKQRSNRDTSKYRTTHYDTAGHRIDHNLTPTRDPILWILNGIVITPTEGGNLNPDDLKDIRIIQPRDSTGVIKYGDKGKYGVVEMVLKKEVSEKVLKDLFSGRQKKIPVDSTDNSIFKKVEIAPYFKGDLRKFIDDNLVTKKDEKGNQLTGVVTLKFIVNIKGTITDIVVDKRSLSSNEILIKEAKRLIMLTDGNWAGGEQNGRMLEQCFHYEDIIFK